MISECLVNYLRRDEEREVGLVKHEPNVQPIENVHQLCWYLKTFRKKSGKLFGGKEPNWSNHTGERHKGPVTVTGAVTLYNVAVTGVTGAVTVLIKPWDVQNLLTNPRSKNGMILIFRSNDWHHSMDNIPGHLHNRSCQYHHAVISRNLCPPQPGQGATSGRGTRAWLAVNTVWGTRIPQSELMQL